MDLELHRRTEQFRAQVDQALEKVRLVLDNTKHPQLSEDVQHTYEDKYLLAELLTNTALSSQFTCLSNLGITSTHLRTLSEWAKTRSVSLGYRCTRRCQFNREVTREEDSKSKHVTTVGRSTVFESKIVTTITEYFWDFTVEQELLAYVGTGEAESERITLMARTSQHELMSTSDSAPFAQAVVQPSMDVNITHLVGQICPESSELGFKIDREHADTHTPRRNRDVQLVEQQLEAIAGWSNRVRSYLLNDLCAVRVVDAPSLDMGAINAAGVLSPVLPLFEDRQAACPSEGAASGEQAAQLALLAKLNEHQAPDTPLLRSEDVNQLLEEERKSLARKLEELQGVFADPAALVSHFEASLAVVMIHLDAVRRQHLESVDYIEKMLRRQLVAAIGKVVTPDHFAEYIRFHNNKLFRPEFAPQPCAYAIRRTVEHSPQGLISIERKPDQGDAISEPINTIVCHSTATSEMKVRLSASTEFSFGGDRFVHGFLCHKFSTQPKPALNFIARARQFSSFIVLLGRISGPDSFEPTYGMIVRNKDEFTLPLDLETIPTPKEFKDAIASLSPEQQDFCKAFRGMQLESTLFGVAVIQIQPQLETLLGLPENGLAKEIQLTEHLMELFIKYQIPSDLLAFEEGVEPVSARDPRRLASVKEHVDAMYQMINAEKDKELAEKQQEALYAVRDQYTGGGADPFCVDECEELDDCFDGFGAMECAIQQSAPVGRTLQRQASPQHHLQQKQSQQQPTSKTNTSAPTPSKQPSKQPEHTQAQAPATGSGVDYTQIPKTLNSQFERLDTDSALRPTIIKPGTVWTLKSQKALLAAASTASLSTDQQKSKKDEAFDLLDGLTRAGALSCGEHAALHVVVAATHCFDLDLMDTVVQRNINPIEKVERSTLIMANTIHGESVEVLVKPEQYARLDAGSAEFVAALPAPKSV